MWQCEVWLPDVATDIVTVARCGNMNKQERDRVQVRIPHDLRERLDRRADREGRSFNDLVSDTLQAGMLPRPKARQVTPKSDRIRLTVSRDLTKLARAAAGADATKWLTACMLRGVAIEQQVATVTARMTAAAVESAKAPALAE